MDDEPRNTTSSELRTQVNYSSQILHASAWLMIGAVQHWPRIPFSCLSLIHSLPSILQSLKIEAGFSGEKLIQCQSAFIGARKSPLIRSRTTSQ
jgi:hypothetical protein